MTAHPSRPDRNRLRRLHARRRSLLLSGGLGASLLLAAHGEAALAQAINATPDTIAGSVDYSRNSAPTPGSETITVNSDSAIINWTPPNPPLPDPYIFLPAGNVVTFQNGVSNADFVVLNRILTNVPSRFDGTVISQLNIGSVSQPGGTVLFSSPGGIILGPTAVFDVGNLVLTSLNVVADGSGNFITASGGFQFDGGAAEPNAAIVTLPGSQIFANSENSYVAFVAPQVNHGGSATVNGSTAFIAAEEVEFSVNQGLFDIVVTTGSDNATPIIHTGSTGGPASGGGTDNHNIYAVAIAKNQAISMLLQGSMGYDAATVAGVENGVIVLSAGYNVTGGFIDPVPVPAPAAGIEISDAQFSSDVIGRATGDITATSTTDDPVDFAGSLDVAALGDLALLAGAGAEIDVGGFADLSGDTIDIDSLTATDGIFANANGAMNVDNADSGGTIFLSAGGPAVLGALDAGSNVSVNASSITLASATAGNDVILVSPGDIDVTFSQAGDDFIATAGGTFGGDTVVTTGLGDDSEDTGGPDEGSNIRVNATGDLRLDNGTAPGRIELESLAGSILGSGLLDAGTDLIATADLDIDIADVDAGGIINLFAGGGIDAADMTAGDDITTTATGDTTIASADSGGSIFIFADGAVVAGTLNAADDIVVDPTSVTLGTAIAGGDILLDATGFISVVFAQAGDDFIATAGTTFTGGTVNALGVRDSEDGVGPLASGNIVVDAGDDLRLDNGDAAAAIRLTSSAGSVISDDLLSAGTDLDLAAAVDIGIDGADAGGDVSLDAGDDIVVVTAQAGDDFVANAVATFAGGTVTATGLGPDSEGGSGALAGSNIVVTSSSDLRLDTGTAADRIALTSSAGSILSDGTLTADQLLADADVDLLLNDIFVVSDLVLATPNGRINGNSFNSDGDIDLTASGNIDLVSAQAGDDFVASAGGAFTGGSLTVGSGPDSEGGSGALAGGNIVIDANGNLRLDNGTAPDAIDLASATGSIFSNGTLTADRLAADAALDVALNDVFVVDDLVLSTPNGSISGNRFESDGDIDLDASSEIDLAAADSGGSITFLGGGDVRLDNGNADGSISLTSSDGSVFSDPLGGGGGSDGGPPTQGLLTAGADIIATAALDIVIDDAQAGDEILLDAGRDVRVANLTAADSVDIDALGTAGFAGAVNAPSISVSSSDIDIGASGALGDDDTDLVTLTALATGQQTVLGGSAEGPGYTLTDAEADRITAATLRVDAATNGTGANRPADVLVRDLSLEGQDIGRFELDTRGIVQVEGGLLLADVQTGGGIEIRADERIQVVNPAGSIRVRDGAGLTDGTLDLVSNNIWSASQSLLDQLVADPNFAGRDDALLINEGPDEPRGYIEAGDVTLSARDTVFVQNSGTASAFAGITVRESTLRIVPTGAQPLLVLAFGRRINPDGSFVTNIDFFREAQFDKDGVGFTDEAQFNLCSINTGLCRRGGAPDNPLPGGPDIIEEPVDGSVTIALPSATDDLVDTSFAQEPLIEEPVTSGSDSILWDCDRDDDGDCDEDDRDG